MREWSSPDIVAISVKWPLSDKMGGGAGSKYLLLSGRTVEIGGCWDDDGEKEKRFRRTGSEECADGEFWNSLLERGYRGVYSCRTREDGDGREWVIPVVALDAGLAESL